MKTVPFFLLALLFSFPAFSQTCKPNQLKLSPLRLMDPINTGVELSYERFTSDNYATQLSLAYMCDPFSVSGFERVRGYRIGLEEKYFLSDQKKKRTYLSAEGVFNRMNFDNLVLTDIGFPVDSSHSTTVYEFIKKKTVTISIKYGVQYYIRNRFVMDVCAGVGGMYFQATSSVPPGTNVFRPVRKTGGLNWSDRASTPGSRFTVIIPLNVKIGYRF